MPQKRKTTQRTHDTTHNENELENAATGQY